MMNNMAMIHKTWILSYLIKRNIEISIFWSSINIIIILCPSYSENINSSGFNQYCIFPSCMLRSNLCCSTRSNIFKSSFCNIIYSSCIQYISGSCFFINIQTMNFCNCIWGLILRVN